MKTLLLFFIHLYRWIFTPVKLALGAPASCRFQPTCSHYMEAAIQVHGPLRGVGLGMRRLCRCHPWGGTGFDPVPPLNHSVSSYQPTSGISHHG